MAALVSLKVTRFRVTPAVSSNFSSLGMSFIRMRAAVCQTAQAVQARC
jgi:hypothetical protein